MNEIEQMIIVRDFTRARTSKGYISTTSANAIRGFSDSYEIQNKVSAELELTVAGWKVAAPADSDVMTAPISHSACLNSKVTLDIAGVMTDGVECELALRIDRPLPVHGCTRSDVFASVGAVMPAFELLSSRLPSKFSSPREQIVADFMGNGAVILGAPCLDWQKLDFSQMMVSFWADDVLVSHKKGGNPFGDPFVAVALLANQLALQNKSIEPGAFVLAGSHTGVHRARPGERLHCVFEGIGEVLLQVREIDQTT